MALLNVDKAEWRPFCDAITRILTGGRAEIEVMSLNLGDQTEAEWLPVLGIVYDPKDDLIEIALDGLDHLIPHPREMIADFGGAGSSLISLAITDGDGNRHVVQLREPLMLPAPQAAENRGG